MLKDCVRKHKVLVNSCNVKSINYSTHTKSFVGLIIWDQQYPKIVKIQNNLRFSKKKIKNGFLKTALKEFTKLMFCKILASVILVTIFRFFYIYFLLILALCSIMHGIKQAILNYHRQLFTVYTVVNKVMHDWFWLILFNLLCSSYKSNLLIF